MSPPDKSAKGALSNGFTLIELSIVLVIIGLIVGGVLVGQDLIRAAGVRATITQVEKFNQAMNTFYGKYGALPGDLNAQVATTFGFTPRGSGTGQGDGNGILQGADSWGPVEAAGETVMFWVDLTYANGLNLNLIDGSFSAASPTNFQNLSASAVGTFFPAAKIGGGNYFYTYSVSQNGAGHYFTNYFGLSMVTAVSSSFSCVGCLSSNPGLSVKQAYDIDRKIDDGLPVTGRVVALYSDGVGFGSVGTGNAPNAPSPSVSTCYDTTSGNYSIMVNNGSNVNCALSFQMQGGD